MQSSRSETDRPARRQDRRDAAAPRLQYEALVEVGADASGGFEAESVDVSLDGMRMRTAYLPEVGSTLLCRFDGFGGEITAEAEVVWTKPEGRGGELGMRFVGLDAHALTLLQDLCNPKGEEGNAEQPSQPTAAPPGTRVRLHIEGLGSPMRARVRDCARGEVLIGSNLEFLKVGRDVELEDMDRGKRRVAHIEHVAVEIDRETNIPQLVVALSYDPAPGQAGDEEFSTAPYKVKDAAPAPKAAAPHESTPEPTVIDSERHTPSAPAPASRLAHAPRAARKDADEDAPDSHAAAAEDEDDESDSPVPVRARAAQTMGALAKRIGPTLASAGAGARGALGRMWSTMRDRQAERRAERAKARAPKRTTAPPPSGALRSDGRRVLRQQSAPASTARATGAAAEPEVDNEDTPVDSAPVEKSPGRRTITTAALAALTVVGIYFASTHIKGRFGADPEAPAAPAAAAQRATPGGDGIANANVPLFGATPLSTTEPVPAPPAPGEAKAIDEDGGDDAAGDAGDKPDAAEQAGGAKEWGVGDVVNPTIFRIKMDDNIGGITGSETSNGFTITIPGRKSISSTAGLAGRDKRLEAVNVVNYPDRAEITIEFKKDVPAFIARAKGKRLEIEISTPKKGHTAPRADDDAAPAQPKKGAARRRGR